MEDNYDFEADMDSRVGGNGSDGIGNGETISNIPRANVEGKEGETVLELTDKHCYYWREDDETTCQNIVIKDTEHDPFCGEECHDKFAMTTYGKKPKSRFERFLREGSKMYQTEPKLI